MGKYQAWHHAIILAMLLLLPDGASKGLLGSGPRTVRFGRAIFLCVLAFVLFVLIVNVYVSAYSQEYILETGDEIPFRQKTSEVNLAVGGADLIEDPDHKDHEDSVVVAIVLGASVYSDGTLSPLLEERAKTAYKLYEDGLVDKLLVSGDNRSASYNEVIPIRSYLLEKGVPAEDIFTDFAGFNTYDSMYRAKEVFGAEDVLVVTQNFHLPRAIYAARHLGLNAYGVPAPGKEYDLKNNSREVFATPKTFFKVMTGAKSLFLGRQISIEGDGRDSLK